RLSEAADYLLRTEPHSPVPYLVKRAVGWGNLSLAELLMELVGAPDDLVTIQRLLGMRGRERRRDERRSASDRQQKRSRPCARRRRRTPRRPMVGRTRTRERKRAWQTVNRSGWAGTARPASTSPTTWGRAARSRRKRSRWWSA